jgi:hypothetical protein
MVLAALAVGISSVTPAVASGESSSHLYMLAGAETRATSVVGTFVGGAVGSQPGGMLWKAVVQHTRLSRTAESSALITGGGVTLKVWSETRLFETTRSFTGGTIAYASERSSSSACGQQVFRVNATLAGTKGGEPAGGGGLLQVYLTHHRKSIFGRCITYAASVRGSLSLSD